MAETFIQEAPGKVPEKDSFDIIVCGGGPAGFAAATAAARNGAKTLLLERNECLGGIWTAGLMPWILDHRNKCGILAELREKSLTRGGLIQPSGTLSVPPEELKFILEEFLQESGVRLRYGTLVTASLRDGKRISHVITESKSGREAWRGKIFIDCTGDGDFAALSGCAFDFANAEGKTQPSSLIAVLCGLDPETVAPYLAPNGGKPRLLELFHSVGIEPSYAMPSLFHFGQGVFGLMSNHGYGISAIDADTITEKILEGRRELHKQVEALWSLGGIWKNLTLVATSERLGLREGRRIRGREIITAEYLASGGRSTRAVCRATMCIDIHSPDPNHGKAIAKSGVTSQPYDIPWGALVSADFDNLLMAGRCISGDFIAHSSYRVTGNSVPMGEAAGSRAAQAIKSGILPPELIYI